MQYECVWLCTNLSLCGVGAVMQCECVAMYQHLLCGVGAVMQGECVWLCTNL